MALRRLFGGQRWLAQAPQQQLLFTWPAGSLSLPQGFPPIADIADSGRTASPGSIAKLNDNRFTSTERLLRKPLRVPCENQAAKSQVHRWGWTWPASRVLMLARRRRLSSAFMRRVSEVPLKGRLLAASDRGSERSSSRKPWRRTDHALRLDSYWNPRKQRRLR